MKGHIFSLILALAIGVRSTQDSSSDGIAGPGPTPTSSSTPTMPANTPAAATTSLGATSTASPFALPTTDITIGQPVTFNWNYPNVESSSLVLCQTNATEGQVVNETNSWTIVELGTCSSSSSGLGSPNCSRTDTSGKYNFQSTGNQFISANYVFLCFGQIASGTFTCQAYSTFFTIEEKKTARLKSRAGVPPLPIIEGYTITQNQKVLTYDDEPADDPFTATGTAPSQTFQTAMPTSSSPGSTSAPPAKSPAASSPAPSQKSGPSTGAKVGIAIGALAIAAILIFLALFCLRRKRHARRSDDLIQHKSTPEQAMLTRDMHTDSFQSRNNILAEKDDIATSSTPLQNLNSNGNGQAGLAAASRRKPIDSNNTPASIPNSSSGANPNMARGVSSVSRGGDSNTSRSVDAYHDHSEGMGVGGGGGTSVPFLREEGMTPDELARLEEEERRIDLAIAEAEGREGR